MESNSTCRDASQPAATRRPAEIANSGHRRQPLARRQHALRVGGRVGVDRTGSAERSARAARVGRQGRDDGIASETGGGARRSGRAAEAGWRAGRCRLAGRRAGDGFRANAAGPGRAEHAADRGPGRLRRLRDLRGDADVRPPGLGGLAARPPGCVGRVHRLGPRPDRQLPRPAHGVPVLRDAAGHQEGRAALRRLERGPELGRGVGGGRRHRLPRLDCRVQDPALAAPLQPERRRRPGMGDQLRSRDRAERRVGVVVPGAPRRGRLRLPRGRAVRPGRARRRAPPRSDAVRRGRAHPRAGGCREPVLRGERPAGQRRRRPALRHHVEPDALGHDQSRFRAGGGRRVRREPHGVRDLLPGKAPVLHGGVELLRVQGRRGRRVGRGAVLLPADRTGAAALDRRRVRGPAGRDHDPGRGEAVREVLERLDDRMAERRDGGGAGARGAGGRLGRGGARRAADQLHGRQPRA